MKSQSEIENYLKNNPYKSDQKIAKRLGLTPEKVSTLRSLYSKSPDTPSIPSFPSNPSYPSIPSLLSGPFLLPNLFLLALLARLIYLFFLKQNPVLATPLLDAEYYLTWAKQILAEGPLGTKVFFTEPLYAYLLAFFLKLANLFTLSGSEGSNQGVFLMLGLQILLGSFLPLIVYKLAATVFNRPIALISALITAVYGPFIFYDNLLLKTSLETFFLTLLLLIMIKILSSGKTWQFLLTGVFIGIIASLKGNTTILLPIFLLFIFIFIKQTLKKRFILAVLFSLGAIFAISPITIRNYIVGHDFVPTNYSVGMVLFGGSWWDFDGGILPPPFVRPVPKYEDIDTYKMAESKEGRTLKPSEVSSFWSRMAILEIQKDPVRYLKLTGKKLLLLITRKELSDNYDYAFYIKLIPLLKILPDFWPISSLALTAIFLLLFSQAARRALSFLPNPPNTPNLPNSPSSKFLYNPLTSSNPSNLPKLSVFSSKFSVISFLSIPQKLIFAVVTAYSFLIVLGSVSSRYRVPLIPFLIILASFTLWYLWQKLKSKEFIPITLISLITLILFYLTNIHLDNFNYMTDANYYNNMGAFYMGQEDEVNAIKYFKKATDVNKSFAWGYANLFTIYLKHGEIDLARAALREQLKLRPDDMGNYYKLKLLEELKDKPIDFIQNRLNLEDKKGEEEKGGSYDWDFFEYMRYFKKGDYNKALWYLEQSAKKGNEPENVMLNMAVLKKVLGDEEAAKDILKKIIQKNPSFIAANYNLANIYIKEKKWEQVSPLLQAVYDLVPEFGDGEAWFYLAASYVNTDQTEKATPLIKAFIKRYQNDPTKKTAVSQFQSLLKPVSPTPQPSTPSATPNPPNTPKTPNPPNL